jgi:hypothetical protein
LLIVNSNKLNHKYFKIKKIACCHRLLHIWATIKEGDDSVAVPFFAAKLAKKCRSPIFCGKAIEKGDE